MTWRSRAVGSVRWQEENCGLGQGTELEHSVLHLLYPPTLSAAAPCLSQVSSEPIWLLCDEYVWLEEMEVRGNAAEGFRQALMLLSAKLG